MRSISGSTISSRQPGRTRQCCRQTYHWAAAVASVTACDGAFAAAKQSRLASDTQSDSPVRGNFGADALAAFRWPGRRCSLTSSDHDYAPETCFHPDREVLCDVLGLRQASAMDAGRLPSPAERYSCERDSRAACDQPSTRCPSPISGSGVTRATRRGLGITCRRAVVRRAFSCETAPGALRASAEGSALRRDARARRIAGRSYDHARRYQRCTCCRITRL